MPARKELESRDIIAEFFRVLEQDTGVGWIDPISMMFDSDKESETYRWLGQAPAMREWIGGRQAKGLSAFGFTTVNRHFEATMEVLVEELRRDKSGQILLRVAELADRANSHWGQLLTTLIEAGESTPCYDGQFFFDVDHSEGSSGAQSNDIAVDISALPIPADEQGSTTDPSAKVLKAVFQRAVQQMIGFVDDQGEPMNEAARTFIAMVPTTYTSAAVSAVSVNQFSEENELMAGPWSIRVVPNARLSWTDKVALFRTDARTKPLIRQEETPIDLSVIAEGSELEFKERKHWYGVDTWREADYGYWQYACLAQLT